MNSKSFGLAAALAIALTGTAYAQQPAGGGSATGNMNNPGSVKSPGQKATEETTGTSIRSSAPPLPALHLCLGPLPRVLAWEPVGAPQRQRPGKRRRLYLAQDDV